MPSIRRILPRISLRAFLVFTALAPIPIAWSMRTLFDVESSVVPTDSEVVQAIKDSGQQLPPKPFTILKHQYASYVDPPFDSTSGRVQVYHWQYKCSVAPTGSMGAAVVVYIATSEQRPVKESP